MWNLLILDPMVNALLWLYGVLGNNYVLSIFLFTILIRLITFPLTWQQQKSMLAMQELQPELEKLKKKHGKDRETRQQKQMELYREAGVNPAGGCLPMLVQFPVLIGLYQAITQSLAASPLQLLNLSQHIYPWLPNLATLIPLDSRFLWLNLAAPDPWYVLPALVVITTFLQQHLLTPPSADPQQQATTQMMKFYMPLFIGYISITFPSGLSIYWVASNLIGVLQYALLGQVDFINRLLGRESAAKRGGRRQFKKK
jgi:YidC/Oxa1 family membrane protein insertase